MIFSKFITQFLRKKYSHVNSSNLIQFNIFLPRIENYINLKILMIPILLAVIRVMKFVDIFRFRLFS